MWKKFNDIDNKAEKQSAEVIFSQHPMPESTVYKSDFWLSLLNVFYLMRLVGDVEQDLSIDSDGAFTYNGLRYELKAVKNELLEVNKVDFVGFHSIGPKNPGQPAHRYAQECLLHLLTIIFLDISKIKL